MRSRFVSAVLVASVAACAAFEASSETSDAGSGPDGGGVEASAPDAGSPSDAGPDAAFYDFGPACQGNPACSRIVFATSGTWPGKIGGVFAADNDCNAAAQTSMIPAVRARIFVAWVSSSTTSPALSLAKGTMPYRRVDGTIVAAGWSSFASAVHESPINLDENGKFVTGSAWTGTAVNGNAVSNGSCSDWTTTNGSGAAGSVTAMNNDWTLPSGSLATCTASAHLYCVEQ